MQYANSRPRLQTGTRAGHEPFVHVVKNVCVARLQVLFRYRIINKYKVTAVTSNRTTNSAVVRQDAARIKHVVAPYAVINKRTGRVDFGFDAYWSSYTQ
jgi:hypothetical protein